MNKDIQEISHDLGNLADHARNLMTATADIAGQKVGEARVRLATALESSKALYNRVHDRAVAGAKIADETVHANPYQAIAVGVGLGAVIGYLVSRRSNGNHE